MKQIVRYRFLTITGKLTADIRLTLDGDRSAEFVSKREDTTSVSLSIFPIVAISLIRPAEMDENGRRVRPPFNPNDSVGMTKFSIPLFVRELSGAVRDMKIPELFKYINDRLEINEQGAERTRRVFMIGNTTIELSMVIIEDRNGTRMEGIKMKFNNEASSVALTINEAESLLYNLEHMNVDAVALQLYTDYVTRPDKRSSYNSMPSNVDIRPVAASRAADDFVENQNSPF